MFVGVGVGVDEGAEVGEGVGGAVSVGVEHPLIMTVEHSTKTTSETAYLIFMLVTIAHHNVNLNDL